MFLAEGIRLAVAAAGSDAEVEVVLVSRELLRSDAATNAVDQLVSRSARLVEVSADAFASVAERENPQGIAVVARTAYADTHDLNPGYGLCWVGLLNPQDPGNVGSTLRTSDAVGGAGVFLVGSAVDAYDPRAVRGSMGSVFTQKVCAVEASELRQWITSSGVAIVGVTGDASTNYRSMRYPQPLLLLMGSERQGLSSEIAVDDMVSIPMQGQVDSLNLAVATSLVLYEVYHQLRNS